MSLNVCEAVRQWRWASRLDLKPAAQLIGISESTLLRFERGEIGGQSLTKVVRWLLAEAEAQQQPTLPVEREE